MIRQEAVRRPGLWLCLALLAVVFCMGETCVPTDEDSDGDGVPDIEDGCPLDPAKTSPGICGCGTSDVDTDGDGAPDCVDDYPEDPTRIDDDDCPCDG